MTSTGRSGFLPARMVKGPLLCATEEYFNTLDGSLSEALRATNGQQAKSNPSLGLFSVRDRNTITQSKSSQTPFSSVFASADVRRVPPPPSSHRAVNRDGSDEQVRQVNLAANHASSAAAKSIAAHAKESPREHANHAATGSQGHSSKGGHGTDETLGHVKSGHSPSGDHLKESKINSRDPHRESSKLFGKTNKNKSTSSDSAEEQKASSRDGEGKSPASGDIHSQQALYLTAQPSPSPVYGVNQRSSSPCASSNESSKDLPFS